MAFYNGDYKTVIAELEKAIRDDPFILVLLAQSHENAGDAARAKYYGKMMANNGYNSPNVFARPQARKKLAGR